MDELTVDNRGICSGCVRGSYPHGKMLEKCLTMLDMRISKALEFGCHNSVFRPEETLEECGPSKSVLLSLLYGLINEDLLLCCTMAGLANQLGHFSSPSLATWLREDFIFSRDQVHKGLLFLEKLMGTGFITVPKQVCDIYTNLLQNSLNQEHQRNKCSYGFNTNLNYLVGATHINNTFHVQRKTELYHGSIEGCWAQDNSATHYKRLDLKRHNPMDDSFVAQKVLKICEGGVVTRSDGMACYGADYTNRNRDTFSGRTVSIAPLKKDAAVQITPMTEDKACNTEPTGLWQCINCSSEQCDAPSRGTPPYPMQQLGIIIESNSDISKASTQPHPARNKVRTVRRSSILNDSEQPIPPITLEGPSLQDVVRSLSTDDSQMNKSLASSKDKESTNKSTRRIQRTSNVTQNSLKGKEEIIIKEELDTEAFTNDELTNLQSALLAGDCSTVRRLIQSRSDLKSVSPGGIPLLFLAIRNKDPNMIKTLLNLGADVNVKNSDGITALHLAIETKYNEGAKILIAAKAHFNCRTHRGNTLLHIAVMNDNLEMVKLLIKLNVDANVKNNEYLTPLHIAIKRQSASVVSTLISAGADINCKFDGKSLLVFAANNAFPMVGKLLEVGLSFDNEDEESREEIIFAASKIGNCDFLPELLKTNVDIHSKDESGWTALHHAVINGHTDVINLLLKKGADVNITGGRNYSPLHLAAINNKLWIVPLLLKHGADLNARDSHKQTPYDNAISWKYFSMADLLKKAAAEKK